MPSLTLLLLTADGAAQNQLHQAAQLRDVAVLPDQGHVRQVLLRHLVAQHLNPGGQEKVRRWAGEGQEETRALRGAAGGPGEVQASGTPLWL